MHHKLMFSLVLIYLNSTTTFIFEFYLVKETVLSISYGTVVAHGKMARWTMKAVSCA